MEIRPLDRAQLAEAARVLAEACEYDRAAEVADEKLFGAGPRPVAKLTDAMVHLEAPRTLGAWQGDRLVGVAAVMIRWIRLIAVAPHARGHGIGSALLAACEDIARGVGESRLRVLDQPGNYLAPGVDARNEHAIAWLERRGYQRGEARYNAIVDVRGNPRVSAERAAVLAAEANARGGYVIRRATAADAALPAAIAKQFGGSWPIEVERALANDPPSVHVATIEDEYCAFAAHDGNNRGLGWFGPAGTWANYRGQGLGKALLVAALADIAAVHPQCEIAWIGPRDFYAKVVGIAGERTFVSLSKPLA